MNFILTSNDPLIFRDGRPFGDAGHVNGGSLRWPWPSTISGVIRCKVGESRDPDFFSEDKWSINIPEIKQLHVRTLPVWQKADGTEWQPVFPAPADALIMPGSDDGSVRVLSFTYEDTDKHGGTDILWRNWLLPVSTETGKPARLCPDLWFGHQFYHWLEKGRLQEKTVAVKDLGLAWPSLEFRMHNGIDPDTGTVSNGRLFSSQGVRLESDAKNDQQAGTFAIGVQVDNLQSADDPVGPCHFGGERKVATVHKIQNIFPVCPDWFVKKRFLRLLLASPGKFGNWAPDWLLPDAEQKFRTVPGTNMKVRLRGAHIQRWAATSGWDFETRGPKATCKLVPAGSVYLLELEDETNSQELAATLWGKSLNNDADGFGLTYIGNINIQGE